MARVALLFLIACGAARPASAPAAQSIPTPAAPANEKIAIAGDPCEGGEIAEDPCAGGEVTGGGTSVGNTPPREPTPPIGNAPVLGSIDKGAVQRVVKADMAQIKACFDKLQQAHPDLEGRVVAKWTIELDGRTANANASGVHPDLETCIVDRIKTWTFPKPEGGSVRLSYPFVFARSP